MSQNVKNMLVSIKNKLGQTLPKNIPTEKFQHTVMLAVDRNQYLLKLDQASLMQSCLLAAADGLLLDGREAALVPFKGKVTYIPMYSGLIKKARNSGEIAIIFADVVTVDEYNSGNFEYYADMEGQHFKHKKNLAGDDSELFCAYMYAQLKDGTKQVSVTTGDKIRKIRDKKLSEIKPEAQKYSPWVEWPAEMWKKTALRDGLKMLPMSTELSNVYERDNRVYQDEAQEIDVTPAQQEAPSIDQRLDAVIESIS